MLAWNTICPAAWKVADAVDTQMVYVAAVDEVLQIVMVDTTVEVADGQV
jgi:hypothetical protein